MTSQPYIQVLLYAICALAWFGPAALAMSRRYASWLHPSFLIPAYLMFSVSVAMTVNLESRSFHTMRAKLKMLTVGNRDHQWMYDGHSLSALLATAGFVDVKEIQPGETGIGNPGTLELRERELESIYVEACQP